MYKVEGRTAVITGAGSGIGRAVAVSLAQRGCHLALSDVNESGLAETVRLVGQSQSGSVTVHHQLLDVADRAAVAAYPGKIGAVDLLINNAGVAVGGEFEQVSEEDFEWLFNINFFGVVRMTRAFLPKLRASSEARIVNLSSVFGLIAPPGQAAYAASKFAVRGFSESLRHELLEAGSNVGVSVVHPGGIATSIADSARVPANLNDAEIAEKRVQFNKHLRLSPAIAGETIVRGIENRKARILVGNDAYAIVALERLAPLSYWKLIGRAVSMK